MRNTGIIVEIETNIDVDKEVRDGVIYYCQFNITRYLYNDDMFEEIKALWLDRLCRQAERLVWIDDTRDCDCQSFKPKLDRIFKLEEYMEAVNNCVTLEGILVIVPHESINNFTRGLKTYKVILN